MVKNLLKKAYAIGYVIKAVQRFMATVKNILAKLLRGTILDFSFREIITISGITVRK